MLEKLRENRKDPTVKIDPSRDEMMSMFSKAWAKTIEGVDAKMAFKENGLTLALDGSEDHLMKASLRSLVGDKLFAWRENLLKHPVAKDLQELDRRQTPPAGVKRAFLNQDGIPFDEVCLLHLCSF